MLSLIVSHAPQICRSEPEAMFSRKRAIDAEVETILKVTFKNR